MAGADTVLMWRHPVSVRPRARAMQPARPSPFHQVPLEIEVTQTLPASVVAARAPVPEAVAEAETVALADPPRESRLSRFISRIPLLRHLRRHPPADESEPR
jgi:hypothetical protein